MSSIPVYGIDRELAAKQKAKYDPQLEEQAREWIEAVTGEKFPMADFMGSLRNGVLLIKLANKALAPGKTLKYSESNLPFKQMENINSFLDVSQKILECPANDLFQTVDLYEAKNPLQVLNALFSFARFVAAYRSKHSLPALPQLGPKLADKRTMSFSDEQLNAGKYIPSQQSVSVWRIIAICNVRIFHTQGYTAAKLAQERHATASGINYGLGRQISDNRILTGDTATPSQQSGHYAAMNATSPAVFGARRDHGGKDRE